MMRTPQETLEHIWYEFAGKLRQFIHARVGDASAAEDILQDVFVKIQTRLNQLKDPEKLPSWIYLITRNNIIDHYRTRKKTVEVSESLAAEREPSTDETVGLKAAFLRMIYSLPEPYQEALLQTEFEGLTQKQLGISLSGSKSRVQRGRHQLKQMLTECCTFELDRRGKAIDCAPRGKSECTECG